PEPSGSRSSSSKSGGSSSSTSQASHSSSDTGSGRVITGSQHSGSGCAPGRDTPRPGSAEAGTRGTHTTPFGRIKCLEHHIELDWKMPANNHDVKKYTITYLAHADRWTARVLAEQGGIIVRAEASGIRAAGPGGIEQVKVT